jgi:hypothetical protein
MRAERVRSMRSSPAEAPLGAVCAVRHFRLVGMRETERSEVRGHPVTNAL